MFSYNQYAAITPSDTLDGPFPAGTPTPNWFDAIYVGGTGNLVVVDLAGNAVTFTGITVGTVLQVRGRRVNSTNTTATNLVGLRSV